jgi:hypothetical protein
VDTAKHDPASRRFSLGDGLILIGALALTISVLRSNDWFARFPGRVSFWGEAFSELVAPLPWSFPTMIRGLPARTVVFQVVDVLLIQLLGSVLLGMTLVQPLMRLRSPRAPLRQLIRQPGLVVCLAVIAGTLILVDLSWVARIEAPVGAILASALLLFWPVLGLPPWSPEASWIDRLGRAVGWGWIVVMASVTMSVYL